MGNNGIVTIEEITKFAALAEQVYRDEHGIDLGATHYIDIRDYMEKMVEMRREIETSRGELSADLWISSNWPRLDLSAGIIRRDLKKLRKLASSHNFHLHESNGSEISPESPDYFTKPVIRTFTDPSSYQLSLVGVLAHLAFDRHFTGSPLKALFSSKRFLPGNSYGVYDTLDYGLSEFMKLNRRFRELYDEENRDFVDSEGRDMRHPIKTGYDFAVQVGGPNLSLSDFYKKIRKNVPNVEELRHPPLYLERTQLLKSAA